MALKDLISAPLEAGASIADGYQLPSRLNTALEYASKRLTRKGANITLVVVQRDYQLPTSPLTSPSCGSFTPYDSAPSSAVASPASTPARTTFAASTVNSFKQLIRSSTGAETPIRERIVHVGLDHLRDGMVSPAFSDISTSSVSTTSTTDTLDSTFSAQLRWPASPVGYGSVPLTPATPFTMISSTTDAASAVSGGMSSTGQFGVKFIHVSTLTPRDEKILTQTFEKTARKFKIGADWLPNAVPAATLGLPIDLINRSVAQNEILFSSESLRAMSLDHLYTFRAALQSYARTQASCRLEDAVDELRRLILANGRQNVQKSTLLSTYRWLDPVSDTALADVCRMYSRAYGGPEGESGVENDVDPAPAWPLVNPIERPPAVDQTPPHPDFDDSRSSSDEEWATPPQSRSSTPAFNWSAAEEKELFLSLDPPHDDDGTHSEIDAIEAWYRTVQLQPVDIHFEPPPQPLTPFLAEMQQPQGFHPEFEEVRHMTPKISAAPPGRSLALRLQTTFEKPKPKNMQLREQMPQLQTPPIIRLEREEEEEEGEMTARPRSAIVTQPPANMRWNMSMNANAHASMSIDSVMMTGPGQVAQGGGNELASPIEPHLGPATPNGYDDISPITRGEWGFLMTKGLPRTARVEMC